MKQAELKKKATAAFRLLKKMHPNARIELVFDGPLELMVATILSAQCTDVRVNLITADLFKKYTKPEDYLAVPIEELEGDIHSAGFFRQKAKSITGAVKSIIENHKGQVPQEMDDLTKLPGIGRKTANVILGNAFGVPGIAVDTHVGRVSRRLGLTVKTDPVKVESALGELFPRKEWTLLSHTLIFHGRYHCKARKPLCDGCLLTKLCDFYREGEK